MNMHVPAFTNLKPSQIVAEYDRKAAALGDAIADKKRRTIALYRSGLSMNAVGKELMVTGQTVERWLTAAGEHIRNRRRVYPDSLRQKAISLYLEECISAAAVAERMGLKAYTVKEWLSAAGVLRSMSEAASLAVARGHSRIKATSRLWRTSTKTGMKHFAESSFEFLRMEQLDADGTVLTWDRCRHRIPYIAPNGHLRHYVPDFLVTSIDQCVVIEEVKPSSLVGQPINQAKFEACQAFCLERGWTFRIVTESDLGYCRRLAPSVLTPEERRARSNERRRMRLLAETPEQRSARLKRNAEYMRKFKRRRKQT